MVSTFTGAPEISYDHSPTLPVLVFKYAGRGLEQRAALQDLTRREWTWPMKRGIAERRNINEFFRLRSQTVTAFYIKDPHDHPRAGVSLGTAITGQTLFTLPTTGNESRWYPNGDNVTVYEDGSATGAGVTTGTDARTFLLTVAPGTGTVMTADFDGLNLVRLKSPFSWTGEGPGWFSCEPEFVEVVQ